MPLSNFLVDRLRNWDILIYRQRDYVVIIFGGKQLQAAVRYIHNGYSKIADKRD